MPCGKLSLMDAALTLLKDLIAIDSVNPSLVPGARGEAEVARALAGALRAAGLEVHVQEVAPGRPNVVGVLEGRAPGRALMFCGHIDTVGVEGMAQPFVPTEYQGRITGRGSQDMKSGVAAMVDAARVLRESGGLAQGRLVVACVVDEEHASIGADALVTQWRADGAVVTEPTDLQIAVAHKGFEWVEVETHGVAAHGSRPRDGRDAIRMMGHVLTALDALDGALQGGASHHLLGTASLHASLISGGRELSSYPDHCLLQLERRTIPGEAQGCAAREVTRLIESLSSVHPHFQASSRALFTRSPYEIADDHPFVRSMAEAATSVGVAAGVTGMSFWTDASVLGEAGIPSVLFGPTGAGLHGLDEWVEARSVCQCRDALVALARGWCR
jgi:acetylornithine deacetylase